MALAAGVLDALINALGAEHVSTDPDTCLTYGTDALKRGHPADVVVKPGSTDDVAAIARLCFRTRTPMVPRGAGTGYTGGAVPLQLRGVE